MTPFLMSGTSPRSASKPTTGTCLVLCIASTPSATPSADLSLAPNIRLMPGWLCSMASVSALPVAMMLLPSCMPTNLKPGYFAMPCLQPVGRSRPVLDVWLKSMIPYSPLPPASLAPYAQTWAAAPMFEVAMKLSEVCGETPESTVTTGMPDLIALATGPERGCGSWAARMIPSTCVVTALLNIESWLLRSVPLAGASNVTVSPSFFAAASAPALTASQYGEAFDFVIARSGSAW